MKILHTSDWHLGRADGETDLSADQRYFISEIKRVICENNIEAVIIAGDVFDRAVASAEAIKLYDGAMTDFCRDLKIPVIIVAGNHDGAQRLESCRELLSSAGLYITGSLTREIQKACFDGAEIFMLPWITEEKVKSVFSEKKDEIKNLADAYKTVTDHCKTAFTPGKRHIIASHAFITDAETSVSDRAAEIGFAAAVPASVFDGFDYVALGHIHKPQSITPFIRYSGSPMPYSFGREETQEKSVTVIDTDDMSQTVIPLALLHRRTTVKGSYAGVLAGDCPDDIKNGFVRIEIPDAYIGPAAIAEIRKIYPRAIEFRGRSFEESGGGITLTSEQFEELENNPAEIFRMFCLESVGEKPGEHLEKLFEEAVKAAEKEE